MSDETGRDEAQGPGRSKPRREPPTIDLEASAVSVEPGPAAAAAAQGAGPQPALPSEAAETPSAMPAGQPDGEEARRAVEEGGETPEAGEAGGEAAPSRDTAVRTAALSGYGVRALALAGGLGGLAGAVAVLLLQPLIAPTDTTAARLAVLERSVAILSSRGQTEALDKRLGAVAADAKAMADRLNERMGEVERKLQEALQAQATGTLPGMSGESQAAAAARLAQVEAALAERGKATDGRLDEIERRLSVLARERGDGRVQAAARALVAGRLAEAARRGEPFDAPLAGLAALGVDPARLASLKATAATGVATTAGLARDFAPLAAQIAAEPAPAAGAGLWDRLVASAARAFRVRPVDDGSGQGPGAQGPAALVARIESALAKGDPAAALTAWRMLPEPARRASEAWGRRLEARVAVDEMAAALQNEAVQALGAAGR
ncbi:hypothetical protein QNA08_16295 [Chelatococcus sp. SYSU_G07232]|uniref:Mitochondrial inner membrane protein n=1 Tax=Chelatococcus albus TaxID=3047466 RepID=A0ABT7AK87_9HYPH|nr:hypothetical protein [Chelatococcus sp. SYSU_G07232]MDJ1159786.1 hypothetical protein [Chelatococcus sp. SYSU_G07232]